MGMIGEMGKTEKVGIGQKPEKTSQSGYCGGRTHWSESYRLITACFVRQPFIAIPVNRSPYDHRRYRPGLAWSRFVSLGNATGS